MPTRSLRDHSAADDLVQDTLERALSRWFLRRADGDLRAWLFTILRNLLYQRLPAPAPARHRGGDRRRSPDRHAARQEAALEAQDVLSASPTCRRSRSRCCC